MNDDLYRMVIAYDGTEYAGWQIQPNALSIQELLQNTLKQILQHDVWVTGSGRTDAGVHAVAQVAHFETSNNIDPGKLRSSLNGLLPEDVRIRLLEPAPKGFHARYSAKGKTYHYHLTVGQRNPFRRRYSTHFPYALDAELLRDAAALFVGKHDFTSFANEASSGSAARNAVRNLYRLDMIEEEGGYRFEFEGEGFLYKMVRNIMGTLIEVGSGRRPIDDIPRLFEAKDRRQAGRTAPPQGLFLMRVDYEGWPQMSDNEEHLP